MDDIQDASSEQRREAENDVESHTRPPPHVSSEVRLVERPRRYSGDNSEDEAGYYRNRRSPRSISHSRSDSPSRSTSPRRSRSPPATPPPPKPTRLHYKQALILRGHKKPVSAVKFSPDGRWIASGSADCTIKIWDARTGGLEHTLEGHLAGISAISWSPDSKIIASGSDDKSIRLWHVETGVAHPTPFVGHHNYVYSLAFSTKGNMLVSGSYDEAVFLWDVRAARVMRSLPAHSDPVSGVDFVRDGTLIASCSHDGLVRVWDTATGQCLRTLVHEDNAPVTSVIFSPNGRHVLAWTLDSCIRLWNYIEGKGRCIKTYQGHVNKKYSLSGAFGTYGADPPYQYAFVASGSEDGEIVIWDVNTKNILQRLDGGHTDAVLSVDTHPVEKLLVSGGMDRTVRVWRAPLEPILEPVIDSAADTPTHSYDADTLPPNPFTIG